MNGIILAVGAGGKFAGLVVPELAKRGARVRGMVRDVRHTEAVRASGAQEVVVADLTHYYAAAWDGIVQTGVLAEPLSNESRFSGVDYLNVAEAAAIALTEDRLLYGTFELYAEGWLNRHDIAALIGEVLGRQITPQRIDLATLGMSAWAMRPMLDHYDRIGLRGNPLTLGAILGRKPRRLRALFQEQASRKNESVA